MFNFLQSFIKKGNFSETVFSSVTEDTVLFPHARIVAHALPQPVAVKIVWLMSRLNSKVFLKIYLVHSDGCIYEQVCCEKSCKANPTGKGHLRLWLLRYMKVNSDNLLSGLGR